MTKKRKVKIITTSIALGLLIGCSSGCGTVMNGVSQSVGMSSRPTGAEVYLDMMLIGKTPMVADLSRRDNHIVRLELMGYEPYEIAFSRKASQWVWGNLVFGGVIGLAVDAITGGLYVLTPEQVMAEFKEDFACYKGKDDTKLFFTMKAKEGWNRVGTLEKKKEKVRW